MISSFIGALAAFTLFGSFFWMLGFFALLLVFLFVSEVKGEGGIAFIALVAFSILNYYWGTVPLLKAVTWTSSSVYLGLGLIFAVIRVFFHGRQLAIDGRKFDVSLITWVLSDLISNLWDFIYQRLGHTFEYFLQLGYDSVKKTKK